VGASRRREMLGLAVASLAVSLGTTVLALGPQGLAELGVYFDGHFYIEIARSFPLPFSAAGIDYMGQAPGFSGALYLARLATPDAIDWGMLALGTTWLFAMTAVLAFYVLCEEIEVPALPASLTFLFGNTAWPLVTSAAHPEPLAITFSLLCFVAHRRGALGWSCVWLSLAMLTRFPAILLGGALAFDLLVVRRRWKLTTFAWLSVPLVVFALHNVYLAWRVPGFTGIWDVHQVHWVAEWTVPFTEMIRQWSAMGERALLQRPVVYSMAGFYLAMTLLGFRPSQRDYWWLAIWTGLVLLLHVSLSGEPGVASFGRLAFLCWPPALLIAWRLVPAGVPLALVATLCVSLGSLGVWVSYNQIRAAVFAQNNTLWMRGKLASVGSDEPHWVDFKEIKDLDRVRLKRREQRLRALGQQRDPGGPLPR